MTGDFVDVILLYTDPSHEYLKMYIDLCYFKFPIHDHTSSTSFPFQPACNIHNRIPLPTFYLHSEQSLLIRTSFHVTSAYGIERGNLSNLIMKYLRHTTYEQTGVHSSQFRVVRAILRRNPINYLFFVYNIMETHDMTYTCVWYFTWSINFPHTSKQGSPTGTCFVNFFFFKCNSGRSFMNS